ncbi:hypothetical protein LguiB_009022 [Lonicera macranthoides]
MTPSPPPPPPTRPRKHATTPPPPLANLFFHGKPQANGMVNLEIEQGNVRSKKGNSSESLKVIDERKRFDIDSDVQSLIYDDLKADVNSSSNPTKTSGERKKRKKKKSCKADDKDGMQNTEQTYTMPMRSLSDEHHTERNEDKVKRTGPDLEQGVEGFVDFPSVKLSVGQKKRRKKRRKMERNGNDKDAINIMDETKIMLMRSLSGEHHVPGNEDKLRKVENELKQEVEGSFVDDNTPSTKECVEEKKKGRSEKRRKGKANDKDGTQKMDQADIISMGSLSQEHHAQGNADKLKIVERELKQVVEGSFADDENTRSAKECVEQKEERRRRRKDRKANDKGGIQSMDQTDIISMGSLSDQNRVQGKEDQLKRVEHELKQEVEGSFVDDKQKKKGRREKRMKGKTNDEGGLQSMSQADIISAGSLSDEHRVQGSKDKLKAVEHELKQEVQGSCVDDENTASAKESVEQKKERRRRRKDRKANDSLSDEYHVQEDRDKPKKVENELDGELQGSVVDDENTQSAKEGVEPKKERRRRKKKKENGKDGIQSMDQTDVTSIRGLSDELHVQEDEDKPKRVEHELDEEVEGSVVDNENTQSARQSEEPDKGRRRRKKKKDNGKDGIQSMDQTDVTTIQSLCDDYHVQENENELERAENELEREVKQSFVDCDNSPLAKDCVKAKRKKRGKKKRKANVNGGMPGEDKKDVDDSLMGSNLSLGKTLVLFPRRKLLVLDINGLLADVVHPPPKHCKADIIFKRPFYYDFLKFCFERFDVGIWSSRSKRIIDPVVNYLLGELKHKLLFCWDLSYCTTSGFNTLENKHKPLVFKEMRLIWEKSYPNFPWEKGDYNESNTLLLDDSPYKALLNPKHTAIFPRSYTFMKKRDNSLGPGGELRVYLEKVATAENVQTYVEKHPFGQVGIDETNRSWDFYSRVLSKWSIVSASTE